MEAGKAGEYRDGFGARRGAQFLKSALEGVCDVARFALDKELTTLSADCFFWYSSSTVISKEILNRIPDLTGRLVVSSTSTLTSLSLLSAHNPPPLCHHVREQYVGTYHGVSKIREMAMERDDCHIPGIYVNSTAFKKYSYLTSHCPANGIDL